MSGPVNPTSVSDGQDQNDEIDDDDEDLSESQSNQNVRPAHGTSKPQSHASSSPNNQFGLYPNPSIANLNLPPIIVQTLEMAAAAPPPPIPLLSSANPMNFDPVPMPMSNESNVVNESAHNKPALIDPEQSEKHPEKPSESTEPPSSMLNEQNSVPHVETPTNVNSMTKPTNTVKQYRPIYLFGSPLYQSAYYNQYNTYIPYFLYPFRKNIQSHTRKNLNKSKRVRSPQKSSAVKSIIINIS